MRVRSVDPVWFRRPYVIASGVSAPVLLALVLYLITR